MSRFDFRLKRVLRVRQVEEEVACNRFRECVAVMQRAEEIADGLGQELQRSRDELVETRAHKRVPPEELLLASNTLQDLEATLAEQRRRASELKTEADELRRVWESARRDRMALEQLEDRRRRDHLDEEEKRANQELDEIARRRAAQARAESAPADHPFPGTPDSPDENDPR